MSGPFNSLSGIDQQLASNGAVFLESQLTAPIFEL
jgi:hypothetical protein